MLILVDEDIPGVPQAFAAFGEVRTFPGRFLRSADLVDADALIVRAVTRVDEHLLSGSRVRFVGTVTTGTDHVDPPWLERHGIAFAHAAGSNADAVAEYVLAAVLLLAHRLGFDPCDRTLGVVGVGRIGSRVVRWARALGMSVLLCDPPLRRQTGDPSYIDGAELARCADIVTLHVPLTDDGPDATRDFVDEQWLASLKPGAILLNTSRGEVVREDHLTAAIEGGRLAAVGLDVWRNEPHVDSRLLERTAVATPHIAGYSAEAKARAVGLIRDALAAFAGSAQTRMQPDSNGAQSQTFVAPASRRCITGETPVPQGWITGETPAPAFDRNEAIVDVSTVIRAAGLTPSAPAWRQAAAVVAHACGLVSVDRAFRAAGSRGGLAEGFDEIRRSCTARREFGAYRLPAGTADPAVIRLLSMFGFKAGRTTTR